MRFEPLRLAGTYLVHPEPTRDERGLFARTWCRSDFAAAGVDSDFVQSNVSVNTKRGTLRGLHHQREPFEETKLIRCTRGEIYDVIVDVRHDSPTRWQWEAVQLAGSSLTMLFIPKGFAHGFQTLVDDTEVCYQMGAYYRPEASMGLRWDDPHLKIDWPVAAPIVSARDRSYDLVDSPP